MSSSILLTRLTNALILTLLALIILTSCNPVIPVGDHQLSPVPVTTTAIPTSTPQPTPTVTPHPKVEVLGLLPNEDGRYTTEQLAVIASEGFVEELHKLNNWWLYWAYAAKAQQPFLHDIENAMIAPYFDNDNPQSFSLAIQAEMDDGNLHTFLQPIDRKNATFREFPPVEIGIDGMPIETGYDIPAGFGPLEITGVFGWDETYEWVKFDENGDMYQTINYRTGQWLENEAFKEKDFDFSSAITPGRLLAEINYFKSIKNTISNWTEMVGRPYFTFSGHIIAYQLKREDNENSLKVLLVTKDGITNTKVDYVIIPTEDRPPLQSVNDLTYDQASIISDYLNKIITNLETTNSMGGTSFGNISVSVINNEDDRKNCINSYQGYPNSKQICSFDSSFDPITSTDIEAIIKNAIVSVSNQSFKEVLEFNNNLVPLLSKIGNISTYLQIPPTY